MTLLTKVINIWKIYYAKATNKTRILSGIKIQILELIGDNYD